MKKLLNLILCSACAIGRYLQNGLLADQKGPISVSRSDSKVTKTGKSCAKNVFGIYSHGDNSIEAARKNGGLKTISHADYHVKSILGIYTDLCTIVSGN